MGFRRIDGKVKAKAVRAVLAGEDPARVAEQIGVSRTSVDNWCRDPRVREVAERTHRQPPPSKGPTVELVEVLTLEGRTLVVANVGRDGLPTGTVQRVAGAPLGTGPGLRARMVRRWAVDIGALRSALDAAESNLRVGQ